MRCTATGWKRKTCMSARKDGAPKESSVSPVAVKLVCGHAQRFFPPPRAGDLVFCYRCDDYVPVSVLTGWRTICQAGNCPMSREYGLGESKCYDQAVRHAQRYGHVVGVHWSGALAYAVGPYGRIVTKP